MYNPLRRWNISAAMLVLLLHTGCAAAGGGAATTGTEPLAHASAPIQGVEKGLGSLPSWFAADAWGANGELVDALRWKDVNGDNLLLVWRQETRDEEDGPSVYATVSQFIKAVGPDVPVHSRHLRISCLDDLTAAIHLVGVFDADEDGAGEAAFTLKWSCRTDVSGDNFSLHVWEDDREMLLLGQTLVCDMDPSSADGADDTEATQGCIRAVGGKAETMPFFERTPAKLRAFALNLWREQILKEYDMGMGAYPLSARKFAFDPQRAIHEMEPR